MTRHEKRLHDLLTIADDLSSFDKHKHAAAIYVGNKLVSVGVNQLKSHPLQKKFGMNSESIYLHAEVDAIKNALKRISPLDMRNATLYIAKSKNGVPRLSKPCVGCQRAIIHFGIPNVYWTE
jgi:tRNA(Arg) A34 adenosine deaminase TadA